MEPLPPYTARIAQPARTITILHLSDFHYAAATATDQSIVVEALITDLARLRSTGISIDLVAFSGDLVFSGDQPDDFLGARTLLLDQVLSSVGLPPDRLVVVPGNHDVARSRVDSLRENSLLQNLRSRDETNQFLDHIGEYRDFLGRLANFDRFATDNLSQAARVYADPLCMAYSLTIRDLRVDIAALNSAWRATGAPNDLDYGHLLLGERQLDHALEPLNRGNLRVAIVHHPLEYLAEHERHHISRRFYAEFDVVLMGHTHHADPYLRYDDLTEVMISDGGCLFSSRDYFNGYSVLTFDVDSRVVTILLREYSDNRRAFDKCLRLAEDGRRILELNRVTSKSPARTGGPSLDKLVAAFHEVANETLLTSAASAAPKQLDQIFVMPTITTEPEEERELPARRHRKPTSEDPISVSSLLGSRKHTVLVGRHEGGRTTLLHYLGLRLLETAGRALIPVPVRIGGNRLRRRFLEREAQRFLGEALPGTDGGVLLREGSVVLLLDDILLSDSSHLALLKEFLERYPTVRIVMTVQQDLHTGLNLSTVLEAGSIAADIYYIHHFGSKQIRYLVERWYRGRPDDIGLAIENLTRTVFQIGLPRSPFVLSLLLLIMEGRQGRTPPSRAAVVEAFVEILLEKRRVLRGEGALDYRNQQHFLSRIAWRLAELDADSIERSALERETLEYFENKGLNASISTVLDAHLQREMLVSRDHEVRFKFQIVREYFFAKAITEDSAARSIVTRQGDAWRHASTIDLVTGLERNSADFLEYLKRELATVAAEAQLPEGLGDIDTLTLQKSYVPRDAGTLVTRMRESLGTLDDDMDELVDSTPPDPDAPRTTRVAEVPVEARLLITLFSYSRVVRNCELLDDVSLKREHLRNALRLWARMVASAIGTDSTLLWPVGARIPANKEWEEAGRTEEQREAEEYVRKVAAPLVISGFVFGALGSAKLSVLIEELSGDGDLSELERMLVVFLRMDLRLGAYLEALEVFCERHDKSPYVQEVVCQKLATFYTSRELGTTERRRIENCVAELYVRFAGSGNKHADERAKAGVREELKSKMLERTIQGELLE